MRLKFFRLMAAFGGCSACCVISSAATNRLVNGDFEATPADTYFDGFDPSVADDVPGWNLFVGAADGSYVLVNGVGSGNVDVDMANGAAGGGLETAAGSRPAVVPGDTYKAYVTYDNYFSASGAAYFIDWFDGGGSLLSSVGGPLGDPNGPFGYEPYSQLFQLTGIAPAGSAAAGVRFTSSTGYNGLAADNFSFVPEPATFAMLLLAAAALVGFRSRRRS